ncbi:SDR family oxidoreductase [Halosegnis marinus]|uniref:SDR family oxidoreductase n=1 Tax=Halosegnis marinus TaxID=3034023 RepID=A0ABD5ZMM9_9EURY|nr:SDR family oxidoreductase [Halosegnis sp. DT85]
MERTILVTGASSGIGRATARAFNEEEWTVYATARDTDDVGDLAEAGCETAELDVTDGEQVEAVVDRIVEEHGRVDCLVNNAGYGQHGPAEDVPADLFERQLDVNVVGPHRLVRAVLPHMRAREEGTIVNVSSVAGRLAPPGMSAYSASKFALEGYSDALRNEVARFGIDVALVEPGPVETNFRERAESEMKGLRRTDAYDWLYEAQEDASLVSGDSSPFASTPEEVANTILEAGVSTDPDPRYVVGGFAKAVLYGRFVPDRLRDRLLGLAGRL